MDELLDRHLAGRPTRYLDFACGTGRILRHLESRVANATGVDVSQPMLTLAAEKLERSTLVHGDATRTGALLDGPFDLVTSFRFFLNAEPSLREDALRAIRDLLSDDGLFVFDVHGNATSLRALGVLVRRHVLRTHRQNQLTLREVDRLLRRNGLELVEFRGFGLVTPQMFERLGAPTAERIEALARVKALQRVCVNLVFACRRAR